MNPPPLIQGGGLGATQRSARIEQPTRADSLNLARLKASLPAYLHAIGHSPNLNTSGDKLTALCPLHNDSKPSFQASLKGDVWQWFCHPCGHGGTVIDLHAHRTDRDARHEFRAVCDEIASFVNLSAVNPSECHRRMEQTTSPRVSAAEASVEDSDLYRITNPWRSALGRSQALQNSVASRLGVKPGTIRALTTPCFDALGIVPAGFNVPLKNGRTSPLKSDCLAYIYEGAYKLRAPWGETGPRFMMIGSPRRPWRSCWLNREAPFISDVHLVESESSAIALVDAGFERPFESGSCVVAVPGATGFKLAWATLFTGKTLHFWPDADEAGERFLVSVGAILHPHAKRTVRHRY